MPFITGQYTNTSTNGGANLPTNPFQTIERKDVGLTPEGHAARERGRLRAPGSAPGSVFARAFGQRRGGPGDQQARAVDPVLVSDDATLALGGLISSDNKDAINKVPALGDIPVIGNLFRYRSANRSKRDLMVFLHPKILRDAAAEAAVSGEKYNSHPHRAAEDAPSREVMGPKGDPPVLPEMHDFLADPKAPPLGMSARKVPRRRTRGGAAGWAMDVRCRRRTQVRAVLGRMSVPRAQQERRWHGCPLPGADAPWRAPSCPRPWRAPRGCRHHGRVGRSRRSGRRTRTHPCGHALPPAD